MHPARALWIRIETIHAVTYFGDESRQAAMDAGLRGFWMGYFGFRAAPLGAVDADIVTSAFFSFAPRMVERSIPDAWTFAAPAALVAARGRGAAATLRRVAAAQLEAAGATTPVLEAAIEAASADVAPLFDANRALAVPQAPAERIWQLCTTLREHRGDAHVAALRQAGLDGCDAHLLLAADQGTPEEVFRGNRGWSADEWEARRMVLVDRGLLRHDGSISAEGRALRHSVEATTDTAAARPFGDVGSVETVIDALDPAARAVAASGVIPYPNPMGLPPH